MEIGIALEASRLARAPKETLALARLAEERGLDLVVVSDPAARRSAGLDPWTMVVWLAGSTSRIAIGAPAGATSTPDPTDPEAPYPGVVAKAQESLGILAPGRIIFDPAGWVVAPRDAKPEDLARAAETDLPVVVPVDSREEVERLAALVTGRGRGGVRRRSAAVRSHRRPAIDYDGLPASLAGTAVEPGDPSYRSVSSTYLRGGAPGLVLRPRTPAEVSEAIGFARRHRHLPLGIRSAGHGISGRSTNRGGLVIDVGAMNTIEVVDPTRRLVRIGPGATWKQVAAALTPHGWALGSGDYGGVGVGGLATAAGIGLLSRNHGLTIDRLRSVDLVLADGRQVRASREQNPELFWAVRGAGANFGIATSFEFEVDEVGEVGWAQLILVTTDIAQSLHRYGELAGAAPRDTTVFLVTGQPRDGMSSIQLVAVVDNPDPDIVVARLTPFLELGMLARQQVVMTPYAGVMGQAAEVGPGGHHGFGEPNSRSAFLPALTPEFARDAAAMLRNGGVYFFELRAMGGAIADVAPDDASFTHRTPAFQLAAIGQNDQRLNAAWEPLRPHFDGLYLSFETDRSPQRLLDAFPAPVLARLRALKRRYDPDNLFRDNFNIDPQPVEEARA
ncbi:LLM class flavin-dependent oxidoreductase [Micromonospora sp. DT229]|uniref:FAD-binding oxidoreductase n=1 Tax=Micromonospora sp. DT229 TaxID=3393430 RepID=UPI003CF2071A